MRTFDDGVGSKLQLPRKVHVPAQGLASPCGGRLGDGLRSACPLLLGMVRSVDVERAAVDSCSRGSAPGDRRPSGSCRASEHVDGVERSEGGGARTARPGANEPAPNRVACECPLALVCTGSLSARTHVLSTGTQPDVAADERDANERTERLSARVIQMPHGNSSTCARPRQCGAPPPW